MDPHSYGHQRLFPALRGCSTRSLGPTLLGAGFLCHILSPTGLVSNLTDFLSSPSYIIVQSPTQYLPITGHRDVSLPLSLEWHVWLSSSGNNCHAVHRSLFSGSSIWLYRWILPCPILSAKPAYANWICNFHVFGMACLAASKVNIQHLLNKFFTFGLLSKFFSVYIYIYIYRCVCVCVWRDRSRVRERSSPTNKYSVHNSL